MTRRDARIVRWSRLYRLLADRDEYMSRDLDERINATSARLSPGLSAVDAEAIEDVTEIDRLCGAAVRLLRGRFNAGVADLLGWLDQDRLAAVALALPERRRLAVLDRDFAWAQASRTIDTEALREAEGLIADFDAAGRVLDAALRGLGVDVEEFTEDARRHLLDLPSDLSDEERQLVEDPRRFLATAAYER